MYDILIIGAGPAGLSAAIYAVRAGLSVAVFEKMFAGGQVVSTYEIENYPGMVDALTGPDLAYKLEAHARKFNVPIIYEEIVELSLEGDKKIVRTAKGEYSAAGIILAMGANPKPLGLPREKQLIGSGVGYCATCDGAFFANKDVAVVGSGNTAVEDALFLARFCNKVYLIHRRDILRADNILVKRIAAEPKIQVIQDSIVTEIHGEKVESLTIENVKTGFVENLDVRALFVAVGTAPKTDIVKGLVNMTPSGHIITDENMRTNVAGVYAAGDIRDKLLRQVITAVSDGAIAATVFANEFSR